ncbi:MAG: tetratricopeptide repeat protein [Flavobacteriaceae bacterium]
MNKLMVILFVLLMGTVCNAQKFADRDYYLIDSLVLVDLTKSDSILIENSLKQYHSDKAISIKISALSNIINNCWTPTTWVFYNEYSYLFAKRNIAVDKFPSENEKTQMIELLALTEYYKGYTNDVRGIIAEALLYYQKGLETYKSINNQEGVAMCMNNIGELYFEQGKVHLALANFQRGLDLSEKIDYKEGVASNNRSLGDYYYAQKEFDKALECYEMSLKINKELEDQESIGYCFSDIGNIYELKKDYEQALSFYMKALQLHESIGDRLGTAKSLSNIAFIHKLRGSHKVALNFFKRSLDIYEKVGDNAGVSAAMFHIANINFEENKYEAAFKNGKRSLSIAQKISFPRYVQRNAELLYKILKHQKKGMDALEMFELFVLTKDSLNNIETQKALIKQQTKYEYEKQKAADDAENDKLVALEKEEKQQQQIVTAAVAGGLGLTGIFLFVVFNRLRITKKQKVIIENQKEEVENQRDIANHQKLIVEVKNKEILESITYAKRIQEAILPPPRLVKEWLTESFIFYKPKDIVAGDFYWMETATYIVNGKEKTLVYFAAADCTGHGVPGAMVSVVCANALNRAIKEFNLIDPGEVLDKVTDLVIESFDKGDEDIKDGMDIALCALDISSKKVFYSGANNPLYRVTSINEKVEADLKTECNETHQLIEYKANKQPIGLNDRQVKFSSIEIQLEPGDAIYVFSDGFPDQFGGVKGKKYKYSSFRKTLLSNYKLPMEEQKQMLSKEFDFWKGDLEQVDDVCVIGVKINGVEKKNFTLRELEVLSYLQDGLPSKLIADKMSISKNTVDTYRRRLLAKTGTYNSTELINYCIQKEII